MSATIIILPLAPNADEIMIGGTEGEFSFRRRARRANQVKAPARPRAGSKPVLCVDNEPVSTLPPGYAFIPRVVR